MKFDTNIDITKHFVEEAYGILNEEVISFIDYKKDLEYYEENNLQGLDR